jgi:hypothetical protein
VRISPSYITVTRPCVDGFRLCFLPPSWASIDSPSWIPASIPWRP